MTTAADPTNQPRVKAESAFATLLNLWPYMWPGDRPDLKRRVGVALVVLVAAKVVTMLIPYTYKWATDALVSPMPGDKEAAAGLTAVITVPILLVIAYGVGRILMNVFNNLRDALFAKVGQHAVRELAYKTFVHMHELSLRFHLQRRTGGMSRIIERGTCRFVGVIELAPASASSPDPARYLCARVLSQFARDKTYMIKSCRESGSHALSNRTCGNTGLRSEPC